MSPALLSKRLRTLERAGVIRRDEVDGPHRYHLTDCGEELQAGRRGPRRVGHPLDRRARRGRPRPAPADVGHPAHGAGRRVAADAARWCGSSSPTSRRGRRRWWLCVTGDDVDVCDYDPGFDVAATVVTTLSTMIAVWRGDRTWDDALRPARSRIDAPSDVRREVPAWLGQMTLGAVPRRSRLTRAPSRTVLGRP